MKTKNTLQTEGPAKTSYIVKRLGEIIGDNCFQNGLYKHHDSYRRGVPIIRINDFDNTGHLAANKLSLVDVSTDELRQYEVRKNDILINRVNSMSHVGKSIFITATEERTVYESNMMRLRIGPDMQVIPEYIATVLQATSTRNFLRRIAKAAVAQVSINQDDIRSIPIILYPRAIQIHISIVFSAMDLAIKKTQRLIIAQRKQFSWLLNRLIDQRSVKDKWRRVKLGEVAEINKGQQLNVADMVDTGKYYALNGGIEPSGFTHNWNTHENTITISEGGNSCGFVNFNTEKFWCGGHCYALTNLSSEVSYKYLYHFLKAYEKSLMSMRVGSGLPNIQRKDLYNFSITFPPLTEQIIIAETLDTARQEIDLLKKQAEAYRKQKRGLMQKLLTGQWRVGVDNNVE